MNYTFFIGNGFDLSLGLKTSYSDFIEVYRDIPCSNKNIRHCKAKLQGLMHDKSGKWADLEEALGQLTDEFPDDERGMQDFFDFMEDITLKLIDYLQDQMALFKSQHLSLTKISSICDALENPLMHVPERRRHAVCLACNAYNGLEDTYHFVSFNYTPAFDQCLEAACHSHRLPSIEPRINQAGDHSRVLHMHGVLDEHLILGVDHLDQVANTFHLPADLSEGFVKPVTLDVLGLDNKNRLANIIEQSHFIIVYGMSLGVTDRTWWQNIGEWLHEGNTRHLIIHVYDKANACVPRNNATISRKYREQFFSYLPQGPGMARLRDRVHVIINKNIFGVAPSPKPPATQPKPGPASHP